MEEAGGAFSSTPVTGPGICLAIDLSRCLAKIAKDSYHWRKNPFLAAGQAGHRISEGAIRAF